MGVKVAKYINLQSRCSYWFDQYDDGYFIEPYIIKMMLFDELKIVDICEFLKNAVITITEDKIKEFLDKKFEEENPELKKRMEEPRTTASLINLSKVSINYIKASSERFKYEISDGRYHFEPDSLQYFKTYTSILREKCQTLISVLEDIEKSKLQELPEESKQRFLDLDFHFNEKGNIYFKDAERLADAIIYNIKDLREKLQAGNNPETYLTFKKPKHGLMKGGILGSKIYPREEIQIRNRIFAHSQEFIALSEKQQTQLQKEEIESYMKWLECGFATDEDEEEKEKNPQLVKSKKSSEK